MSNQQKSRRNAGRLDGLQQKRAAPMEIARLLYSAIGQQRVERLRLFHAFRLRVMDGTF